MSEPQHTLQQHVMSFLGTDDNKVVGKTSKQWQRHELLHYFNFKNYVQRHEDVNMYIPTQFPAIIHRGVKYTLYSDTIKQIFTANDINAMSVFKTLMFNLDSAFVDDAFVAMSAIHSDEMWLVVYDTLKDGTTSTEQMFITSAIAAQQYKPFQQSVNNLQRLRLLFPGDQLPGQFFSFAKCLECMLVSKDKNDRDHYGLTNVRMPILLLTLKTIELTYFQNAYGNTGGYGDETTLLDQLIALDGIPSQVKQYIIDYKNGQRTQLEVRRLRDQVPRS